MAACQPHASDAGHGPPPGEARHRPGGGDDGPPHGAIFDEPAGVAFANGRVYVADTNNHLVRVIDLDSETVSTLELTGLRGAP